jgi:hypothetical protein
MLEKAFAHHIPLMNLIPGGGILVLETAMHNHI